MSSCALLPGRTAVTWVEGVFPRAEGPELSERIDLYRPEASRFGRWLGLVGKGLAEVRLAVARTPHGRWCLLALTPDGEHFFQAVESPKALPADAVDRFEVEGTSWEGVVRRRSLLELAGCLRPLPRCRMVCRPQRGDDGAHSLAVLAKGVGPAAAGLLPMTVLRARPGVGTTPFLITAEHARLALENFEGDRVLLRYRPDTRSLVIAEGADRERQHYLLRTQPTRGRGAWTTPGSEC